MARYIVSKQRHLRQGVEETFCQENVKGFSSRKRFGYLYLIDWCNPVSELYSGLLGVPQGGPNRRDGSSAARVHPAASTKARSTGRQQSATTAAAAATGGAASGSAAGVLQLRWYERVVVVVTVTDPSLIVI